MSKLNRVALLLLCGVAVLLLDGCVERRLLLRSDPPGARVSVNGEAVGITPTSMRFLTYGKFEVVMSAPGRGRLQEAVEVDPPWWETIPLDFLLENVCPFIITDEREVSLTLKPLDIGVDAGVDAREKVLRERLEAGEGN